MNPDPNGWPPIVELPHEGSADSLRTCGKWSEPVEVYVPSPRLDRPGISIIAQCEGGYWLVPLGEGTCADLQGTPTHFRPVRSLPMIESEFLAHMHQAIKENR